MSAIVQMSGGEWARKLISKRGKSSRDDPAISFQTGGGTWRPARLPTAESPAPHGAHRTRPGALSGRRGRGPAERLARDAGETARAERDGHLTGRTPGRRSRERAGRPERHAPAGPGPAGAPPAPDGASAPSPARTAPGERGRAAGKAPSGPAADMDGSVRPANRRPGDAALGRGPPRHGKGPRGPSNSNGEKKRGRRGGDAPAAPPRPSPLYTGRAPSTGQRRPALPRAGPAVPSALGGLASGFGMGPGVPRPPWPLTGGRRSSCDDCVPPTLEGVVSACPGGRTASSTDPIPLRPQVSRTRQAHETAPAGMRRVRARAISAARLRLSPALHLRPINQVVYLGPYRKEN